MPLGISFIQETTIFREYGPLSGSTMRLSYDMSPKFGSMLSNQTADLDARYYGRIGANGVLALRARAFKSWGAAPNYVFFGGNSEMRGYDYREFLGHKGFYTNAELRFPLIEAMLTPVGIMGGIRGVFFANLGGSALEQQCSLGSDGGPGCANFKLYDRSSQTFNVGTAAAPSYRTVSGFRLVDSRASYGIGLETFALGFPVHFDWSYRTMFNKGWETLIFGTDGAAKFRRPRFAAWIGYDF
jgi:outer membrane protein assembly factor BamA